jgi:hypothetical protein
MTNSQPLKSSGLVTNTAQKKHVPAKALVTQKKHAKVVSNALS